MNALPQILEKNGIKRVPVIENGNIQEAIGELMELVLTAAEPVEAAR